MRGRALAIAAAACGWVAAAVESGAVLASSGPQKPRPGVAGPGCTSPDWLVCAPTTPVTVSQWSLGSLSGIQLSNGLLTRSWVTSVDGAPAFALWDFTSAVDAAGGAGTSLLRTLTPEATLTLNGQAVPVGGLVQAGRVGPANFTLLANDSATACEFVGNGPTTSLAACLGACWGSSACNIVNWTPGWKQQHLDTPQQQQQQQAAARRRPMTPRAPLTPTSTLARGLSSPAVAGGAAACMLSYCVDPIDNPSLNPADNFTVYATDVLPPGPRAWDGAFLNRSGLDTAGVLTPTPGSLVFLSWSTSTPTPRFAWTPGRRGSPADVEWPPQGLTLTAAFTGAAGSDWEGIDVQVHYEVYVGLPSVSKWVTIAPTAGLKRTLQLSGVEVERLGLAPPFAPIAPLTYAMNYVTPQWPLNPGSGKLGVVVDHFYASTVNWTDVNANDDMPGSSQPVLVIADMPDMNVTLSSGRLTSNWTSVRAYEILFDDGPEGGSAQPRYPSSETYFGCTLGPCTPGAGWALEGGMTERRGLTIRRLFTYIAPQGLETPLQNHMFEDNSTMIRSTCDEMASVGFEMLVLGAGSGADVESSDPKYRARVAGDVNYCLALGIEVGFYDLIGWTRDPGHGWAALNSDGSDSGDACFASGWESFLHSAFFDFAGATNLTALETDGPFAGYSCSNSSHVGHHGIGDSITRQSRNMCKLYNDLASAGMYINAPDSWWICGSNIQGIGYNEGTFRLSDVDLISLIQRQVIYDATYYTQPSRAWSQIPQGTYNYTSDFDIARFEAGVAGQMGMGIANFLNQLPGGPLLPVPAVGTILAKWAAWYKAYRTLLGAGDVIHIARPDGQGLDALVHVRAGASPPALLVVNNPTGDEISAPLMVPLWYAGLAPLSTVHLAWNGSEPVALQLDVRSRAALANVTVPPRTTLFATIE